ncbi:GNAT family N-acetyltransferase [Aquihabitans sp. G128]|uniref:GNAT family N-acetyltransferase n=1 Tax=Aquihabitans sp. G128 TaxID=2849779 RepID=UPI001C22C841|nr:GNAT family N-acetyltransferase [Aquihabitans sp. G128]QXC60272.1 GNAT family N-acetyltransferase [Aquihabitans sp. G128]
MPSRPGRCSPQLLAPPDPRSALRGAGPAWRRARRVLGSLAGRARGRVEPPAPPSVGAPDAEVEADTRVVLVGVALEARGAGAVDALLGEFARRSVQRGHRRADLLVVADNPAALRAYERNGWRDGGAAGAGTVRYLLDLAPG